MMTPSSWITTSTGDLIKRGKLEIGDGYRAKHSEFADSGVPFLRIGNIQDNGFRLDGADLYPDSQLDRVQNKLSQPGDCVIATKATIGRLAYIDEATPRVLYSPQVSYWRVLDKTVLEPRFVRCWLASPEFLLQAHQAKSSTAMADYINLNDQRRMRITLPPIQVQRRIAAVVAAYDKLIQNNLRRIAILEDMAQALYREWFCEFRFPGHEDVDLVDSELGPIPLGWAIGHFLEICQSVRSPVSPHKEPDAAFYHYSFAAYDRDQTPDVEYGRDVKSSKLKVAQPSVLLAKLNPRIPRVWRAIPPGDLPAYASSEFIVLVPKRTKLTYLYAAASNSEFTRRLAAMSVGTSSSHQRLKVQDLEQMPVVLPPDALVDLYDKHCGPMLELAEKLRQQNANLRTTRDLLLPKLVSGEIDVSDLDIDTDWLVA